MYPNGKTTSEWSGGLTEDGNYRLDGKQVFYYENGAKQWESTYAAGKRTGTETFWNADGTKKWERIFGENGSWTWRVFDANGTLKAESKWLGKRLIDPPQPATRPAASNTNAPSE